MCWGRYLVVSPSSFVVHAEGKSRSDKALCSTKQRTFQQVSAGLRKHFASSIEGSGYKYSEKRMLWLILRTFFIDHLQWVLSVTPPYANTFIVIGEHQNCEYNAPEP